MQNNTQAISPVNRQRSAQTIQAIQNFGLLMLGIGVFIKAIEYSNNSICQTNYLDPALSVEEAVVKMRAIHFAETVVAPLLIAIGNLGNNALTVGVVCCTCSTIAKAMDRFFYHPEPAAQTKPAIANGHTLSQVL